MACNRVAFVNGKGGCGKTTSIFHVAGVLANKGEKVLVIDLDKQCNTTATLLMENKDQKEHTVFDFMLGQCRANDAVNKAYFRSRANANPKYYGVDVMGADERLEDESLIRDVNIKEKLDDFIRIKDYTWVLVDMPPSSMTLNNICLSQIVDFVIVPFTSDFFSVSGYGDLLGKIDKARETNPSLVTLGVYLSRYMENCRVDKFIKDQLIMNFGDIFIDVQIPLKADIRDGVMDGRPISYYKLFSPSRTAYEELVEIMVERISQFR